MQDRPTLRDAVVGLFVVVGLVVIVVGAFAIRGLGVGGTTTYHVRYENVSTLNVGSAVKYNGLLVGRVRNLEIDPEAPRLIRATLEMNDSVPVTTATVAQIEKADLLGDEFVDLEITGAVEGSAGALQVTGEPLPPGSFIQAGEPFDLGAALRSAQATIEELGTIITLLRDEGQRVFDTVGEVMDGARQLVSDDNRQTVERALENVAATTASTRDLVESNAERVSEILDAADEAVQSLRAIARDAEGMVDELRPEVRAIVADLRNTVQEAETTLVSMRAAVEDVDAARVNDLLDTLETTARNFAELSSELKRRPSLLIRGKKADVKGLPR